jgi:hypothetical protein
MARDHPSRCPRQQVQQPHCPSCGKWFTDILRHLNHRQSTCANWFNTTVPRHSSFSPSHEHSAKDFTSFMDSSIPDDFSSTHQLSPLPSHPRVQRIEFPGAAKVYGQTKTFMDRFNDDQYSGFRTTNIYYPFAGKTEWDLASFLLSSGLSMGKIDDFLRLKMVIF